MAVALLDVAHRVGAAGRGGVFAGRQGRRDRDRAHRRRLRLRAHDRAVGARPGCGSRRAAPGRSRRCRGRSATIFAASVTEPPPSVTSRSAPASRAAFAAATTSIRGVCAPIRAKTPAKPIAERLPHLPDHVGLAVQRAAREQEHGIGAALLDLLASAPRRTDGRRRRSPSAENDRCRSTYERLLVRNGLLRSSFHSRPPPGAGLDGGSLQIVRETRRNVTKGKNFITPEYYFRYNAEYILQ